jgi:peptidoglycan/LPS O-acetylase OafA/YrhL
LKLSALTSLRFFAAFGVFLDHYFQLFHSSQNQFILTMKSITGEGFLWVTFFFVLSGFIISYSYDGKLKTIDSAKEFIFKRIARLWPVNLLLLVFFVANFYDAYTYINVHSFLSNAFFLQSWSTDVNSFWGYNAVSWSLSCEAFFYVSFIVLGTINRKYLVAAFMLLGGLVVYHLLNVNPTSKNAQWLFYVNPSFRVLDFMAGMLVYEAYKEWGSKIKLSVAAATIFEVGSFVALASAMTYAIGTGLNGMWRFDVFYLPVMVFMVFIFALGQGAISKALSNNFLMYLGEASFCLYMCHLLINGMVYDKVKWAVDINSTSDVFGFMLLMACVCVGVSCFLFSYFERPINGFLRKAWKSKEKTDAAAANIEPAKV